MKRSFSSSIVLPQAIGEDPPSPTRERCHPCIRSKVSPIYPVQTVGEFPRPPLPPLTGYAIHTSRRAQPAARAWKYSRPWRKVIGPGGLDLGYPSQPPSLATA